jgi:hypothetical protein
MKASLNTSTSRANLGKKRKSACDYTSSTLSSLRENNGVQNGAKRIKTEKRGGSENEGVDPTPYSPNIPEKKDVKVEVEVDTVERSPRLSRTTSLGTARQSTQIQLPLTPPVSYRTIQPKGLTVSRAVSEPPSPSNSLVSPSSKSNCSTVADEFRSVDLDNPFLETPVGLTRSTLVRRPAPDTPIDLESERFREKLLNKVKSKNLNFVDESEFRREHPPIQLDSKGERSYLTYVL